MNDDLQKLFFSVEGHLLSDNRPSLYLNAAAGEPLFSSRPFSMLLDLKSVPQPPEYHPEGDVWNHTLLVVDEAAALRDHASDVRAFMWAALLHDLGKPGTTRMRNGKIIAYGHDTLGATLARDFLSAFGCDTDFIDRVVSLVQWHMQILYFELSLSFFKPEALLANANVDDIALLSLCDRLGRKGADRDQERLKVQRFLQKIKDGASAHRP